MPPSKCTVQLLVTIMAATTQTGSRHGCHGDRVDDQDWLVQFVTCNGLCRGQKQAQQWQHVSNSGLSTIIANDPVHWLQCCALAGCLIMRDAAQQRLHTPF